MIRINRRSFLQAALAAGAAPAALSAAARARPSDALNIAVIGVQGQGWANIGQLRHENIVALCDVDAVHLERAARELPDAARFRDFRALLTSNTPIDAVLVATPDHVHAAAALAALDRGLPVYCEKPLAHSVDEVRRLQAAAHAQNVPTQMGTQIHAGGNYRRVVELIRAGAIGTVRAAHVWCNKSWSNGRFDRPAAPPAQLDWNLWQGPVPERRYFEGLHPGQWRRFWDYGTGTLGDMGCHYLDLVHWALELGPPRRVRALGPARHPDGTPDGLVVTWEHPGVTVTWSDGPHRPSILAAMRDRHGAPIAWGDGQLFVGDDGFLLADYGRHLLLPEQRYDGFAPPPRSIPDSIGHHREWLEAIRGGAGFDATTCHFGYSGALTEAVLLGNVAFRAGGSIEWDAERRSTGDAAADGLLSAVYRDGWGL